APLRSATVLEGRGTVPCTVQAPALQVGRDIAKRIRKDGARHPACDIKRLGVSTGLLLVSRFEKKRQTALQAVKARPQRQRRGSAYECQPIRTPGRVSHAQRP